METFAAQVPDPTLEIRIPSGETIFGEASILSENSVIARLTPSVAAQLDSTKTY